MIKVVARANKTAEILIHESIGEDWFGSGLTSKRFARELKDLGDVDQIHVRINSPGGSVTDGVAIYNTLKAHGARVDVTVEGMAASIASIIAMAGDKIVIGQGALMMIHSPWTFAVGSSEDMRETADVLDKFEAALIDIYESRSGQPRDSISAMLKAETWMNGEEAVRLGFADEAMNGGDEEAAALLIDEHKAHFKKFAKEFRQPADITPQRIAAALSPSAHAVKETQVTEEEKRAAAEAAAKKAAQDAAQAALKAETDRRQQIRDAFGKFSVQHRELLDACLDDVNCSADAARAKLLAKVGDGVAPTASVQLIADSRDKFLVGAGQAIMVRAGVEKREGSNEFYGRSLCDLAEAALKLNGISTTGLSKDGIARKVLGSHTTSDFPLLLSNTAGKVLRTAYALAPITWNRWCKKGSVPDFKPSSRHTLGSFSSLLTKPERGEYKQGTTGEERETITAGTKGRYISLSREMIVNDDLGGFADMSRKMGRAAARTVEKDVYALLTSAAGAGPTMSDGGALFNATAVTTPGGHANLTSSGTAISVASIAVGEAAMLAQKDKTLEDFILVQPKVLLCSPAKKQIAWEVVNSLTDVSQANAAKKNYVQSQLNLEVVASPYLSGNPWYLFADANDAEVIEVAFLDGVEEPFIDEEIEFMTDSLNMKVRLDYGVAAIDWRPGYRNAGA